MSELHIEKISYDMAKPFILQIHYARRMPCVQYAFGLFAQASLIGVVTYGQPASPTVCKGIAGEENRHRVLELNRLVIKEGSPKNSASFLVSHSLKLLPKDYFIVSYADTAWGHCGYVYQATNWLYTGMTNGRTDEVGVNGGHPRHGNGDKTKRTYRSPKYRYVFITGNHKKQNQKLLRWKIIDEYPKGDNTRYDTDNPVPIDSRVITKKQEEESKYHDTDLWG